MPCVISGSARLGALKPATVEASATMSAARARLWNRMSGFPECDLRALLPRYSPGRRPQMGGSAGFAELLEQLARFAEGVVAHRHAAIDRLLQNNFLDVVGGEAALDQRGAHVHA